MRPSSVPCPHTKHCGRYMIIRTVSANSEAVGRPMLLPKTVPDTAEGTWAVQPHAKQGLMRNNLSAFSLLLHCLHVSSPKVRLARECRTAQRPTARINNGHGPVTTPTCPHLTPARNHLTAVGPRSVLTAQNPPLSTGGAGEAPAGAGSSPMLGNEPPGLESHPSGHGGGAC